MIVDKGVVIILVILVAAAAVIISVQPDLPIFRPGEVSFKEVPRFESYDDLVAAFEEARTSGRSYGMWETLGGIAVPMAAESADAGAARRDSWHRVSHWLGKPSPNGACGRIDVKCPMEA